jgi:DNA-binding IclR family transcriptional regulator
MPAVAQSDTFESRPEFSLSVSRALKLLSLFNHEQRTLSVVEASRALALSKTSTLRFIQALEMHGYVERDPKTRRYHPGVEAARVGSLFAGGRRIQRIAEPILEQLVEEQGVTAYLSALQDDRMVILHSVEAPGRLKYSIPVGEKLTVHSSATGHAALSTLAPAQVDAVIARAGMPARTSNTITTLPRLKAALRSVVTRGYSVNWEEHTQGVGSVAAPVRRADGSLVCVLSLGFATSQVTRERFAALGEVIKTAAALMARRISEEERKS